MEDHTNKKFTWVIKDFSSLQSEKIYSDIFVVGDCKWRLMAFPKGNNKAGYFSIYLDVPDQSTPILPCGWRRHAQFSVTIVNQILTQKTQRRETRHWFDKEVPDWGFTSTMPLSDIHDKGSGFMLNGELKVVVNIELLEVIGQILDVLEETSPLDVIGFKLLPAQVKTVKLMLESHPEIASKLLEKNSLMKSAYMNLVLNLIETLSQSPKQINKEDMADAYATLEFVTNVGFGLDWLKEKLDEVFEKKEKLEACETLVEKLEEELNDLKHKSSEVEALLEKKRAELSVFRAPLSDDDIFR